MADFLEDIREFIKIIFEVIYLIIIIFVTYQVLHAVLGGTWASENIIIAGVGIIMAGLFVIVGFLISQSKILGKLEERTHNFDKRLEKLEKRKK